MSLENLEFELPRRGIVFKPETEMPDGSLLGFDADPNTASGGGTAGEQLLYNAPSGTRYIQKSEDPHLQWIKTVDTPGGLWVIMGSGSGGITDLEGGRPGENYGAVGMSPLDGGDPSSF